MITIFYPCMQLSTLYQLCCKSLTKFASILVLFPLFMLPCRLLVLISINSDKDVGFILSPNTCQSQYFLGVLGQVRTPDTQQNYRLPACEADNDFMLLFFFIYRVLQL